MRSASLTSMVRLRPLEMPLSWVASEDLKLEREMIESSSEGSSLLPLLPEEGLKIGWPFRTDSQLCGWVEVEEVEEVAVMTEEPQR